MKKLLCVIIALMVTACECGGSNNRQPMSNEQIIEQTKICNEAGLDAESLHTGLSDQTTVVQCKPRVLEDKVE